MTASASDSKEQNATVRRRQARRSLSLEPRKIRKPLMERKRRARINQSLDIIKEILLEANAVPADKEGNRHAKLEKADILELTIAYIQSLPILSPSASETLVSSFPIHNRSCRSPQTIAGTSPSSQPQFDFLADSSSVTSSDSENSDLSDTSSKSKCVGTGRFRLAFAAEPIWRPWW